MGIIPQYLDQVNSVIRWWENPCDAPWTLYAELAREPLGDAILTLLAFGLDDVARGFLRPKGIGRVGRHARKGRRGRRGVGIPEIGEMIGRNWPGAEDLRQRSVSDGVKKLWLVDGVIQRGLFWWMIADVTLTFLADWLTAVQESEVCSRQRVGSALWNSAPTVGAIQGWRGFGVTPEYQVGSVHVLGSPALWVSGFGWSGGAATVVFAADGYPIPRDDPDIRLETRVTYEGNVIAQTTSSRDKRTPFLQGAIIPPTRLSDPGTAACEVRCVPHGFFEVTQAFALCIQTIGDLA